MLGDLVFFGAGGGLVIARDRATGAERWRAQAGQGEGVQGANLVARAGVVVAPAVGHVTALDAATGRERWTYYPPDDVPYGGAAALPGQVVKSRLDADDEAVYIPAWGASVSAVDLRTGVARWVWEPGPSAGDTAAAGRFRSGAVGVRVAGDTVFATAWHSLDANGLRGEVWLVALDRATGRELWRVVLPTAAIGGAADGAPALHANLVLVGTRGGHVWAVDRATRDTAWHFAPPPVYATLSQPEVRDGVVYRDGGDERLYALRASDGAVLWRTEPGPAATRDLLVTERRVYVPRDGRLYVLDRATGRRVTEVSVRGTVGDVVFETPPTAADGQVFVGTTTAAVSLDEP